MAETYRNQSLRMDLPLFCFGHLVGVMAGALFKFRPPGVSTRTVAILSGPATGADYLGVISFFFFLVAAALFGASFARPSKGPVFERTRVSRAMVATGVGVAVGFAPTGAMLALLPPNWRATFWLTTANADFQHTYEVAKLLQIPQGMLILFLMSMSLGFMLRLVGVWSAARSRQRSS